MSTGHQSLNKPCISQVNGSKETINLKVFNFNAQGLKNKFAQLNDFIHENDPDILVITETHFDCNVLDSEFKPQDYQVFRKDRKLEFYTEGTYSQLDRGGVLILVKSFLNPVPYDKGDVDAEILWITINPRPRVTWLIGGCYRTEEDEAQILEKINKSIDSIDTQNCLLLGDFNFRKIDWNSQTGTSTLENSFIDTINDNCLTQIVTDPTRGNNILDLVFVGDPALVEKVSVQPPFSTSDHSSVCAHVTCPVPRISRGPRKVYLYSKGDYNSFNNALGDVDWDSALSSRNIEENWSVYTDTYQSLVDLYVPHKMVRPGDRHKPPWMRYKSVEKGRKAKRSRWIKARDSGLFSDLLIFDSEKKKFEDTIKTAKAHYEDKLVDRINDNPKLFWNYTRHFTKTNSSVDVLEIDGRKITEDHEKADALNNFFTSVLINEPPIDSLPNQPNVDFILRDFHITPQMVREKLLRLKQNKASGPDGISVNILRQCPNFDIPLAIIFNQSLQTSQIPQDWRDADVTPLHKKGSKTEVNNYRPVSLTSQVVKLLERLVLDRVISTCKLNKFFSCDQHGFQDGCSCVTQLLECLNDWTQNLDSKKQTDVIYLDFSKAFDTVPHARLCHKLRQAGIRGKVLDWISSFLSNRRQRVVLRNGVSSWRDVTSGVPQGSILGPILFLIYVNDIPDSVQSTAKMFADDTKLYRKVQNLRDCDTLQEDLNTLASWSQTWLLNFNATKCVVLKIKQSLDYIYTLNGVDLEQVSDQKDLGVIISDDLKPGKHIVEVTKKANQRIGLIHRCFTNLTDKKVSILYQSLVRPILEYGSPAWDPWQKKDIDLLESVQKRCFRFCVDKPELESLESRRKNCNLNEMYKFTHNLYKSDPSQFFSKPYRKLRGHSYKLYQKFSKTDTRKYFFANRHTTDWNRLTETTVSAPSLPRFKESLRSLPERLEG